MSYTFRLSRVRAPRGTLATSLLFAVVFIGFGLIASGLGMADAPARPLYLDGSATTIAHWLSSWL